MNMSICNFKENTIEDDLKDKHFSDDNLSGWCANGDTFVRVDTNKEDEKTLDFNKENAEDALLASDLTNTEKKFIGF